MRKVNNIDQPSAGGSIVRFEGEKIQSIANGLAIREFMFEVSVPVKNNTGGALTVDPQSIAQRVCATFRLEEWKDSSDEPEIIESDITYQQLHERHRWMRQRAFKFLDNAGTPLLQNLPFAITALNPPPGTVLTLAAAGTGTVKIRIYYTFLMERFGTQLAEWCPGSEQARNFHFIFTRSGTVDFLATDGAGIISQNGAASFTMFMDPVPARFNRRVRFPRLYRNQDSGLESYGPPQSGGLIGLWEESSVGASTALTTFSLKQTGLPDLHTTVDAGEVVGQASIDTPLGGIDVAGDITPLYEPKDAMSIADIPVGRFVFEQINRDLNPPKLVWLYVPTMTKKHGDRHAASAVRSKEDIVKLVSKAAVDGQEEAYSAGTIGISPHVILRPGDTEWSRVGGIIAGQRAPNGAALPPFAAVPTDVARQAQEMVKNASAEEQPHVALRIAQKIAKGIPGVHTEPGQISESMAQAVRTVAPPETHGGLAETVANMYRRVTSALHF